MRVLYGGTFDPVHLGHVAIGHVVARALACCVAMLPAADPPHRPPPGATAAQRADMLALAVAGDPLLTVDRRELDRTGPSFTVDTLAEFRLELGPATPIVWVLGMDSLAQLATWHDWRRILDLAHVLAVQRPETSIELSWLAERAPEVHAELACRAAPIAALAGSPGGHYASLAMRPLRSESATQVRQRIAAGLPWEAMVPGGVAGYIRDNRLYGAGGSG